MLADREFGISDLGHWDLFEIWFLMLGILRSSLKTKFLYIQTITCLNNVAMFLPFLVLDTKSAVAYIYITVAWTTKFKLRITNNY